MYLRSSAVGEQLIASKPALRLYLNVMPHASKKIEIND